MESKKIDINVLEVYENDIDMYIKLFMEEQNIADMKDASQSVWNGCLLYIYYKYVKNNPLLLKDETTNKYNIDKVYAVMEYYIYLCKIYDKECSGVGFSHLTGISQDIINVWSKDSTYYRDGSKRLSKPHYEISQKLTQAREESLSDKLISNKSGQVGIIAALNHRFGWSSPYVSETARDDRPRISRQEVQRIGVTEDIPSLPEG